MGLSFVLRKESHINRASQIHFKDHKISVREYLLAWFGSLCLKFSLVESGTSSLFVITMMIHVSMRYMVFF